jgi:hypothetical protein
MKVMYDTEFLERPGGTIAPISIGMVREDGREYYAVYADMPTLEIARNEWLMENVMASIGHKQFTSHVTGTGQPVRDFFLTDPDAKPQSLIRMQILEFVYDIKPEWWAWYGAYDHVVFCQTFGRMIDLPAGFPMFTNDLKQFVKASGNPQMPEQPAGKHNALEDARFNWERYNFLTQHAKDMDVKRITGILDRSQAG